MIAIPVGDDHRPRDEGSHHEDNTDHDIVIVDDGLTGCLSRHEGGRISTVARGAVRYGVPGMTGGTTAWGRGDGGRSDGPGTLPSRGDGSDRGLFTRGGGPS